MNKLKFWLVALCASIATAQAPVLLVENAWARQAPGSDVAAVYVELRNITAKPVVVIGVSSPAARHSMIHETKVVGGQSQMRMLEKLVIAPGERARLAPGGVHIMLSGLKQGVNVGKSVPIMLLLADGGQVSVAALVRPLSAH